MRLLIGPSNAGKSTWIERTAPTNVCYAFQFVYGGFPSQDSVLHYNLLFLALARQKNRLSLESWDLLEDPFLDRCLSYGFTHEATVIVAPIGDLLSRAKRRRRIEKSLPRTGAYPKDTWLPILEVVNIHAMYQTLFDILESRAIPYQILFNGNRRKPQMHEITRSDVPDALSGTYVGLSDGEADAGWDRPLRTAYCRSMSVVRDDLRQFLLAPAKRLWLKAGALFSNVSTPKP
ncbi:hypothetical protein SAMN05877809_10532 [Rhodobacter sp. JA431]|uniref:hypothetical protein n=1 Tax=Rhodobacter sp. JA431 TaxID=570013 RepID=UPI000BD5A0DE|nr:hypothetical protein [Rhodobacter sp. JA431]SOC09929.1 hypothetical protein SAMN05877809_10532 [Rhodobacter sp. JA431]